MTLIYLLAGILGGSIALVGALDLVKRIRQRVRVYRVGQMLHQTERDAYRERPIRRSAGRPAPPRVERGVSRSVWEDGSENS